jgi:hypothetical protein
MADDMGSIRRLNGLKDYGIRNMVAYGEHKHFCKALVIFGQKYAHAIIKEQTPVFQG